MTDKDLLRDIFYSIGVERGLSEEILAEVLDLLIKNQFVPAGERLHIRSSLEAIITRHAKGN